MKKGSLKTGSMYLVVDVYDPNRKPLKETMWYWFFTMCADNCKTQSVSKYIYLEDEKPEDVDFILEKLNSTSKSHFFMSSDGSLASHNFHFLKNLG